MNNPFITIGYSGPEYFCDREEETSKLERALRSGRNVTLISPRRLGKTGLIQHTFHRMRQEAHSKCFYLDIYNTQNQLEFVQLLGQTILGSLDGTIDKIIGQVSSFFKSCRPIMEFDPITGQPKLSFDIVSSQCETSLKEIFDYLQHSGYDCYVAIDEFQQITHYPEKGTEALLRSLIQFTPNIHFVFSGSKQSLMSEIFSTPSRPFYQSTQKMGLEPLKEDVYYAFSAALCKQAGKDLPEEVFHRFYDFAKGYTWYVQDLMSRLYDIDEKDYTLNHAAVVLKEVKKEGDVMYRDYIDLIATGQRKLLRAIAQEDNVPKPFDNAFMKQYALGALSSTKLALNTLVKNNIVVKSEQGYYIYDRYLSLWLQS